MKHHFLLLVLILGVRIILPAQSTSVDCSTPLESSEKLASRVKSLVNAAASSNRPYTANSFKDIQKFDAYADCAKKRDGENSEDAKKILSLKDETIAYADWNNRDKIAASADSLRTAKRKQDFIDGAYATSCPKENYAGSDKETIKKNLKIAWSKDTQCLDQYDILKVYITGEGWDKEQGYDYSKSSDSFKKYDLSYLDVAVVFVPKGKPLTSNGVEFPDIAQVFRYSIFKDHINGDKINYTDIGCNHLQSSGNTLVSTSGMFIMKSKLE